DKWQPKEKLNEVVASPPSQPLTTPESVPLLTHLPPQRDSFSIEHQHSSQSTSSSLPIATSPIATPIQTQWQQNFPASIAPSKPVHYQPSDYVYRPPELKVMRNLPRYNPNLE